MATTTLSAPQNTDQQTDRETAIANRDAAAVKLQGEKTHLMNLLFNIRFDLERAETPEAIINILEGDEGFHQITKALRGAERPSSDYQDACDWLSNMGEVH